MARIEQGYHKAHPGPAQYSGKHSYLLTSEAPPDPEKGYYTVYELTVPDALRGNTHVMPAGGPVGMPYVSRIATDG